MPIRIVEEDIVDWEPLTMRVAGSEAFTPAEARRIATFIKRWFDTAAAAAPSLWQMAKEWDCKVVDRVQIIAQCEFMPPQELSRLVEELGEAFPQLTEVRLGQRLDGPATTAKFDWYSVEAGDTSVCGRTCSVDRFEISFTPVTLGQFEEFLAATGYEPVPDKLEGTPHYLLDHFKLNFGRSPKQPLYGVTFDDANAFCEWVRLRLPTDAELKHFFHTACRKRHAFKYSGECWTSTPEGNESYVTWNGPYQESGLADPDDCYRKVLHRHQYQFLEAPCFRVVLKG